MTCERQACTAEARFYPVLEWYPLVPDYDGEPAVMTVHLHVCAAHGPGDEAETEHLRRYFLPLASGSCLMAGKAAPNPARTRLYWVPIGWERPVRETVH